MDVFYTNTAEEAAAAGAAFLDEKSPGWRDWVDPTILAMSDEHMCVLGQLYGSYDNGLQALDMMDDAERSYALGFDSESSALNDQRIQDLQTVWKKLVSTL